MAARQTALTMAAMNVDGTDVMGIVETWDLAFEPTHADGHGIGSRWKFAQTVKEGAKFNFKLLQDGAAGALRSTMLDLSVFSVGGASLLGDVKSGTLNVKHTIGDGSGGADLWKYAHALGSEWSLDFDCLIPQATVLMAQVTKAISSTISDKQAALLMTLGAIQFNGPGEWGTLTHGGERDGFQTLKGTLAGRGALTAPTTPASLFVTCTTGSAIIPFYLETGAGEYGSSGTPLTAICESFVVGFAEGQINSVTGTAEVQGAPTYVTS